jgi:hypothetical protein
LRSRNRLRDLVPCVEDEEEKEVEGREGEGEEEEEGR